jgi:hypothetical protein
VVLYTAKLALPINEDTDNANTAVKTQHNAALTILDEAVLHAHSKHNLLTNPGFEVWQRGTGPFATTGTYSADRWLLSIGGGSTLSVSRNTADVDTASGYCAALTCTYAAPSYFLQIVEGVTQLRGRAITLSFRVKASVANAIRISAWDGFTRTQGSYHTGGGAYETLTLTLNPLRADATVLQVELNMNASGTFYVDNATLVVGAAAMAYVPLHPADDLARCQRYYEVLGSGITGEMMTIGQAYAAGSVCWIVGLTVEKAITPTVTVSAAGDFGPVNSALGGLAAFTAVGANSGGRQKVALTGTGSSGLTAGDASMVQAMNTNARVRAEANP